MHHVPLQEAGARLPELIREAQAGGEVIITQDDAALVKLIPVKPIRQAGSAKGILFHMSDDFDETPEDFKEYL